MITTLNWDVTFPIKIYNNQHQLKNAITVGNKFPNLTFNTTQLINHETLQANVSLRGLMKRKPLVISFLSGGWNEYGLQHLQKLKESYPEIVALGGDLLVIVQASVQEVKEMTQYFQLPFTLLADAQNYLASYLGLYNPAYPIWEYVSGISDDVNLPATYVIAPNEKVVYTSIDYHFDKPLKATEMLASVFGASRNIPVYIAKELAA